ncbi:MAG: CrcB family protein [Actinobacteria bacterium]|nr:CrcB family protein [Actinomycetota bacterium]
MDWVALALIALGGILGSLLRWSLSLLFDSSRVGTLAANLVGVALACFFLVAMEHHGRKSLRNFLLPGFCGGLTTFSALAFESVEGSGGAAYLGVSLFLSLAVAALCFPIARKVLAG